MNIFSPLLSVGLWFSNSSSLDPQISLSIYNYLSLSLSRFSLSLSY